MSRFTFASSAAGSKVRIWIEGESAGKPYVRRTELDISTSWEERTVRASDLPAAGLETARLRFELLTPGILWIDDLHVRGEATSRSARLNAQRTLLGRLASLSRSNATPTLRGSRVRTGSGSRATSASGRLARTNDAPSRGAGGRTKR